MKRSSLSACRAAQRTSLYMLLTSSVRVFDYGGLYQTIRRNCVWIPEQRVKTAFVFDDPSDKIGRLPILTRLETRTGESFRHVREL